MDISQYIKPLIKWWRLLVLSAVLALIASTIASYFQPPVYVSRTTLLTGRSIANLNPDAGQIYISETLAAIYADIAKREPVQTATMEKLGLDRLPNFEALVVPNTQLIEITVTDTDPERAQMVAAELANQLILQGPSSGETITDQEQEFIQQQLDGLQVQIKETQQAIDDLQVSLDTINSASQKAFIENQINQLSFKLIDLRNSYTGFLYNTYGGASNNLTIIEPANLPVDSVATSKFIIIALAALVGLSLGAGAAYLLEYMDRSIKTTSDVEGVFRSPVIGYLSEISENGNNATYVLEHSNSIVAESFRLLQSNLEFLGVDRPSKTILITSPNQGNGKTTVAVNLALLMANSEEKVVLVDADMRRPAIHTALGINRAPGLSDMIKSQKDSQSSFQSFGNSNLEVLTVGSMPPNVTEIVGSKKVALILDNLKDKYEVVVVDAPPLVIADAYNLASKVDGVILIMEPGQTSEEQAKVIKEQLDRAGAKVLGIVFNKVSSAVARSYGDFQYLSMYSPQQYNDYISGASVDNLKRSRSGKLLAFIEHGQVPSEMTEGVESAITAIKTQPRKITERLKRSKKNGKNGK